MKEIIEIVPVQKKALVSIEQDEAEYAAFNRKNPLIFRKDTLLYRACLESKAGVIRHLINQGYGRGAFIQAAKHGDTESIDRLISYGFDIDKKYRNGQTLLMWAAAKGRRHFVLKALIKAGAEIDLQDDNGKTALMYSSTIIPMENVKLLVHSGASLEIKDNAGKKALYYSRSTRMSGTSNLLEKSEEKVSNSDNKKEKPKELSELKNGWSIVRHTDVSLAILNAYDPETETSLKRVFDFNARKMITTVSERGQSVSVHETDFEEVDADFLEKANQQLEQKETQLKLN